jgi:microsomal dipeptidase-like Zn-dependent dipeptidase
MRRRRGGLVRGVARTAVVVGTASAVAGGVQHHQQQKYAAQDAEAQAAAQQAADAAAFQQQVAQQQVAQTQAAVAGASGTADLTTQLEQLANLKQQGILTDEEFAAAKAKLLG